MRFYSGALILNTRSVSGWDADVSLPFDVIYNVTFTLKVEIGEPLQSILLISIVRLNLPRFEKHLAGSSF